MSRYPKTLSALLGAAVLIVAAPTSLAQKGDRAARPTTGRETTSTTGTPNTSAVGVASPVRVVEPSAAPVTTAATAPGQPDNAGRDVLLSPTQSNQQFIQQRTNDLNQRNSAPAGPGSSAPVAGAGTTNPGSVISGQVVAMVPGRSVTIQDVTGQVRTFALPTNYQLPVDVGTGTFVVVTAMNGGFVTVANATGVLPASALSGGAGESAPNITQIVAANGSIYRPNLTTQPITVPQNTINGIGGFYTTGAGTGSNTSNVGGTVPFGGATMETGPAGPYANGTFATSSTLTGNDFGTYGAGGTYAGTGTGGAASPSNALASGYGATTTLAGGTFASGGVSGIPSNLPVTSLSYETTPLPTLVARMEGVSERRLPNTALRGGALATISGSGRNLVTRTAIPTYRVVSWDGRALVVSDDHGSRYHYTVAEGARLPNNLQAGKLVVLDVRGDLVRSVRYLL